MSREVEHRNRLLGMITIGFAVLQVILFFFGVTAFFMAMGGLFAHPTGDFPVIYEILFITGLLYGALSPILFVLALVAGFGLKRERGWGRVLTIITAFVALLEIPLGSIYGIYALRFLLGADGKQFYQMKKAMAAAPVMQSFTPKL
jgi:hypothetical protein